MLSMTNMTASFATVPISIGKLSLKDLDLTLHTPVNSAEQRTLQADLILVFAVILHRLPLLQLFVGHK